MSFTQCYLLSRNRTSRTGLPAPRRRRRDGAASVAARRGLAPQQRGRGGGLVRLRLLARPLARLLARPRPRPRPRTATTRAVAAASASASATGHFGPEPDESSVLALNQGINGTGGVPSRPGLRRESRAPASRPAAHGSGAYCPDGPQPLAAAASISGYAQLPGDRFGHRR